MTPMPAQRVAIVTGAGRGIGRAAALELATRGWRVVAVSRRPTLARSASIEPLPADVSDPGAVAAAVKRVTDHHGRIDAVVHCAGLAPAVPIADTSIAQWRDVLDTNLSAAFFLAKAAWEPMKRQGGGVFVNISSMAARDPFPGFGAYAAAKAGLNLFSLVLAREGSPHNIRVHTIAPGAVETEMFRALMTEEQFGRDRTLDPADVALLIARCVEGELPYTSGEVIHVHKTP
jgi:NAD(P)-dependent dehydrogenase (short-subunit alcohol dehydrogenase family)